MFNRRKTAFAVMSDGFVVEVYRKEEDAHSQFRLYLQIAGWIRTYRDEVFVREDH